MLQDLPMLLFGSTPPNTPHCLFHSPAMLSSSRNTQRAWGRSQEPPNPILIRYTPSTEKAWSNLFVKRSPCPGAVGSMGRHRCQRSRAPPRPGMHREPAWLWAQAAAGTPPTAQPSARGPPGENHLFKKITFPAPQNVWFWNQNYYQRSHSSFTNQAQYNQGTGSPPQPQISSASGISLNYRSST